MVNALTKSCSALGPTRFKTVRNEPLAELVTAVVGHLVRGPVLAHRGVAAVAAVSELVAESTSLREGHDPVAVHGNSSIGIRFMKGTKFSVGVCHYIGITKFFLHSIQISTSYGGISGGGQH